MRFLFALIVMTSSLSAFAAKYTCRVTSTNFKDSSRIEKFDADIVVSTDRSMDVKSKVLPNNRKAKMTVLFAGGHDKRFQLQLFENNNENDFISYVSTTVWGEPSEVSAQGQHFDKSTARYEEYLFRCVKL